MADLFKKQDGEFSLSKIMSAIAFAVAILIVLVELFTDYDFKHMGEFLTFTGSLVAMATGRSIMDARGGRNV